MSDLPKKTLHEMADLIAEGEATSEEITQSVLDRIAKLDSKIGAFITVSGDKALEQARNVDARIKKGQKVGRLAGVPLAPKDIYLTKGIQTTCASKILKGYIPPYNGTVIQKCLDEDAVIVGKVNLDEFAMGSSTENSAYGATRNPWNLDTVPGGSSGGSAAAVAADLCAASLGTDTGGSIRQPASLCGIVGLKPTYGRVSRYGVMAFASSLDQMGPMTKDVRDAAILLNIISGRDERDSTSLDAPVPDYVASLGKDIKGLKIGIPKEYFVDGLQREVKDAVNQAIKQLEGLGAKIEEVSLPNTEYGLAAYYIVAPAEASSNLARYDGVRFGPRAEGSTLHEMYENTKTQGFGPEVKRRIMLGTYVLSAGYYDSFYLKAQKARTVILEDFRSAFKKVDLLVAPTAPTTAFKIGEKTDDPMHMYLSDVCTIPVNLAGLPGISLPCGFDDGKLPIGLQMIGKPLDEETLLKVAHAYEQSTGWHKEKPVLPV